MNVKFKHYIIISDYAYEFQIVVLDARLTKNSNEQLKKSNIVNRLLVTTICHKHEIVLIRITFSFSRHFLYVVYTSFAGHFKMYRKDSRKMRVRITVTITLFFQNRNVTSNLWFLFRGGCALQSIDDRPDNIIYLLYTRSVIILKTVTFNFIVYSFEIQQYIFLFNSPFPIFWPRDA